MKIQVLPDHLEFDANPGESILAAALRNGVELTSSCRNGTCRACLTHLKSGEIRYLIEWPGLSAEEKQEGALLVCVACAMTDLVMESPTTPTAP